MYESSQMSTGTIPEFVWTIVVCRTVIWYELGVKVGNTTPTMASVDSCEQACHYINHKGRCRRFHYLFNSNHRLTETELANRSRLFSSYWLYLEFSFCRPLFSLTIEYSFIIDTKRCSNSICKNSCWFSSYTSRFSDVLPLAFG